MSKLPKFKNEDEIFKFFETHSSIDVLEDAEEVEDPVVDQRLKKEITTIRLEPNLKKTLQKIAKNKGIRYQTLISMWLTEKTKEELKQIKMR